ncbi:MAG: hypothetical protein U0521_28710 [Anaerolineae bacterium]
MDAYQPLELAKFCNTGIAFLGTDTPPLIGPQRFRGLPFLIGAHDADPQRCLIGFPGAADGLRRLEIPVDATAHWLIFAHTLLESNVLEGGDVGEVVASYTIQYADGTSVSVPIRERFEVAVVPMTWGQYPFLALPDQADTTPPRHHGEWGLIGNRQTQVVSGTVQAYFLWAWQNPSPERVIRAITLEARRRFAVAGITLSHVDEAPFVRSASQMVKITLPAAEDARKPFELSVDVDRGMATFPYPLPATPGRLSRRRLQRLGRSAQPDLQPRLRGDRGDTVRHRHGQTGRNDARRRQLGRPGFAAQSRDAARRARSRAPGTQLRARTVVDDETGKPVPCRIHFRSPQGIPFQPHGHHNHVNPISTRGTATSAATCAWGRFRMPTLTGTARRLPRGEVIVDAARGFEYEPLRAQVTIAPDQRELTLRLRRWSNLNAAHWYSGDLHVHFPRRAGGAPSKHRAKTSTSSTCCKPSGGICSPTPKISSASRA